MQCLCVCQPPNSSDLSKVMDHYREARREAYELSYNGGGLAKLRKKLRGGEVQKCEDTMCLVLIKKIRIDILLQR